MSAETSSGVSQIQIQKAFDLLYGIGFASSASKKNGALSISKSSFNNALLDKYW